MWPFSSGSSSSLAGPLTQPLHATDGGESARQPPPPPSATVPAPPPPTPAARLSERPSAPGRSSPAAELAAQDAEDDARPPPGSLPTPISGSSALDSTALLIVAAGVAVAASGPSFFRLPPKSPARAGLVLGTWTLTTYALVAHLTEKFKQQEFLEWEAKRLADIETASLSKAAIQPIGYEGGFGGQEGLRDKYATTSGEH